MICDCGTSLEKLTSNLAQSIFLLEKNYCSAVNHYFRPYHYSGDAYDLLTKV